LILHSELVPKKTKLSKRLNKLAATFSRLVNPVLLKFRYGFVYHRGRWQFRRVTMKPKKFRHTYEDGTPNWNLDGAGPLPLDENTARRLVEIPVDGPIGKKSRKSKMRNRRYIPPELGVEGFFDALNGEGINYAVLRWFDHLPLVEPGEDIDILFDDDAMARLDRYFIKHRKKGAIPCDIYSAGGLPGSAFQGLPYFEQRLAEEILANTVMIKGKFKAPDPERHFRSLAYHAVYHKAHSSGLPLNTGEPPLKQVKDHDYAAVLQELAGQLGLEAEISLNGLHACLAKLNWAPGVDTIRKLSITRPVLKLFLKQSHANSDNDHQLCVYVVRDWAHKRGLIPWIVANLQFYGFDVKLVHELDEKEREAARSGIRGGNWNQGPWPVSGGAPAAIIAACDYTPEPPDDELLRSQPFVRNARFVSMKTLLRNGINRYLPDHLKTNPVHSADDDIEAWDYLETVSPHLVKQVKESVAAGYQGDPYLRLRLHRGKRSSSYLVFKDGRPAVLKVFASHLDAMSGFKNEKLASLKFAQKEWAPHWHAIGPNWVLQEYYQQSGRLDRIAEDLDSDSRQKIAGEAIAIARDIHRAGFAHCDLHGENFFLVDGKLVLLDFETLSAQDSKIPFEKSYDITGKGLESPFASGRMCYSDSRNPRSLVNLLKVSLADALAVRPRG
jgi:hypothetical protein